MATATPAAPAARAAPTAAPGAPATSLPASAIAIQNRVKLKTLDGLKAARVRPERPTYFMVCVGNAQSMAYLAPVVGASHKSMLRRLMGKDTGLKYHRGQCVFENGYYVFRGPTLQMNIRKKLEQGLLQLTGRRWRTRIRKEEVEQPEQRSSADPVG